MTYGYHDPFTEDKEMGQSSESKRESMARNLRKFDAMPFYAIASVMNMAEEEVERVCQEEVVPICPIAPRSELEEDQHNCRPVGSNVPCPRCGKKDSFGLRLFRGKRFCYPCTEELVQQPAPPAGEIGGESKPRETAFEDKVFEHKFPVGHHMTAALAIFDAQNDTKTVAELRSELENDHAARRPEPARHHMPISFKEESTPGVAPTGPCDEDLQHTRKMKKATIRLLLDESQSTSREDELVKEATKVAEEKMRTDPCFPDTSQAPPVELSPEMKETRDSVIVQISNLRKSREEARGAAWACDWTETIKKLRVLKAKTGGLVSRVKGILEQHGEPER